MSMSAEAESTLAGVPVWSENGDRHVDVRGLEPPRPLLAILALIERPDAGDVLVVVHDRDPVLLFPELVERGWQWTYRPAPAGQVRLRLVRPPRTRRP